MSKVYMVSTAFVPIRVAAPCITQIKKTIGIKAEWHIWHNHYPLEQELNDLLLEKLFDYYSIRDWNCHTTENVGLSTGLNNLIKRLDIADDDIILATDLDVGPVTPGWGQAIVDVLRADPTVGGVSLMNQHAERELAERGATIHTIDGKICLQGHTPVVQSIIGWTGKSLREVGFVQEQNHFYGGSEITMWPLMKSLGYKWVYLAEYKEEYNDLLKCDGCYRHYKWNYAHLRTTTLSFAAWLNEDPSRLELK
jgi:hypothetical protein